MQRLLSCFVAAACAALLAVPTAGRDEEVARLLIEQAMFCAPACALFDLGNNKCEAACNVEACGYDAGDCADVPAVSEQPCAPGCSFEMMYNAVCDEACDVEECGFDSNACGHQPGNATNPFVAGGCDPFACPYEYVGDGHCDESCLNEPCGYDAGDCSHSMHSLLSEISRFARHVRESSPSLAAAADAVRSLFSPSVSQS